MTPDFQPQKTYAEYWTATLVRGILALLAATAILFLPAMAATILLLPFAIIISILCLAAYGTVDSAIVLVTSFMLPGHPASRLALRTQGVLGIALSIALFVIVFDRIDLRWFLYLATAQAAFTAITEFIVARHTLIPHTAIWGYTASAVAAFSAIALLLGSNLTPRELAWLLYSYLGVFGLNLSILAAHMLFAERRLLHQSQP